MQVSAHSLVWTPVCFAGVLFAWLFHSPSTVGTEFSLCLLPPLNFLPPLRCCCASNHCAAVSLLHLTGACNQPTHRSQSFLGQHDFSDEK